MGAAKRSATKEANAEAKAAGKKPVGVDKKTASQEIAAQVAKLDDKKDCAKAKAVKAKFNAALKGEKKEQILDAAAKSSAKALVKDAKVAANALKVAAKNKALKKKG